GLEGRGDCAPPAQRGGRVARFGRGGEGEARTRPTEASEATFGEPSQAEVPGRSLPRTRV
ncbi:MAG: hypothetical protein AVDCRST_MAG05-2398, partial [uncultured Rubrobacteraceae bacterium]